jgi:hyperosmotically inducible periplasmic protein
MAIAAAPHPGCDMPLVRQPDFLHPQRLHADGRRAAADLHCSHGNEGSAKELTDTTDRFQHPGENTMKIRTMIAAAVSAAALLTATGCAVTRGQETAGAYIDDAAITTKVKARYVQDKLVDATSIKVETLNGTVMLSGFAKNAAEKILAESLARGVGGVKMVKNELTVSP